jgi:hypothetical protein
MPTSESLYNALIQDDIYQLTPGSTVDYGFMKLDEHNKIRLFGAYQVIAKFLGKQKFITNMHNAFINDKLHETVNLLTSTLPELYREHWNSFILNNGKIEPSYF